MLLNIIFSSSRNARPAICMSASCEFLMEYKEYPRSLVQVAKMDVFNPQKGSSSLGLTMS